MIDLSDRRIESLDVIVGSILNGPAEGSMMAIYAI